jgi:hypothetical protein
VTDDSRFAPFSSKESSKNKPYFLPAFKPKLARQKVGFYFLTNTKWGFSFVKIFRLLFVCFDPSALLDWPNHRLAGAYHVRIPVCLARPARQGVLGRITGCLLLRVDEIDVLLIR